MKRDDRMLWLAGGVAAGSLLLATAALTIAIIAAACPPVPVYPNPALAEQMRSATTFAMVAASIMVVFAMWVLAQTIARRPLGMKAETARRWAVTPLRLGLVASFVIALTVFSTYNTCGLIVNVLMQRTQPLTDSLSFGMLGSGLSTPALSWAMLSNLAFLRWWQGAVEPTTQGMERAGATATA